MLNPAQQQAVTNRHPHLLVRAAPGSGKTRVLIERVAALLSERVHPTEALSLTFTRKAAHEMRERLEARLPGRPPRFWKQLQITTFHAWACKLLRRYHDRLGLPRNFSIRDDDDKNSLVLYAARELGKCPAAGAAKKAGQWTSVRRLWQEADVRKRYYGLLREACAVDFDGLETALEKLLGNHDVAAELRGQLHHVLVDEGQDTSGGQQRILDLLDPANLFVVGDYAQCQPAGTMVETPAGRRPIESLRDGDKVLSWSRREKRVMTDRIRVASRPYTGLLTSITTESGRVTECTNNHRWLVRWDHAAGSDLHAVYLMRRTLADIGECYRVGWCKVLDQLSRCTNAHYKQRARLEDADAMWFLHMTRSRADASAVESITSVIYGLPIVMFNPVGTALYTAETLEKIWLATSETSRAGAARLFSSGRAVKTHPIWESTISKPGRQTLFEVVGANLCDGMMVPVFDGASGYAWERIVRIERRSVVDLHVYSMDVERHHAYIADGICTLNCIYTFRGANVTGFVGLGAREGWQTIDLDTNYRSLPPIVDAATRIGRKMSTAGLEQVAVRAAVVGPVAGLITTDTARLPQAVAADIFAAGFPDMEESGPRWSSLAVLSPTWSLLEDLAAVLSTTGIPHVVSRRALALWDTGPARWLIQCLRAAVNPHDHAALWEALDAFTPRMRLGPWSALRASAMREGASILDALCALPEAPVLADRIQALSRALAGAGGTAVPGWPAEADLLLAHLRSEINLLHLDAKIEELRKVEDAVCVWADTRQAEGEPMRVQDLLDWYSGRHVTDAAADAEAPDAVTLCTIHGAKGLEWSAVWVLGCEEGRLPRAKVDDGETVNESLEEQRRLFYVAITRAKDRIRVCHPTEALPSRFIAEAFEDIEDVTPAAFNATPLEHDDDLSF